MIISGEFAKRESVSSVKEEPELFSSFSFRKKIALIVFPARAAIRGRPWHATKMVDISFCPLRNASHPPPVAFRMKTPAWAPKRGGKCSGRSNIAKTPLPSHLPRRASLGPFTDWGAGRKKEKAFESPSALIGSLRRGSADLRICFFRLSGNIVLNRIFCFLMWGNLFQPEILPFRQYTIIHNSLSTLADQVLRNRSEEC